LLFSLIAVINRSEPVRAFYFNIAEASTH